MTKIGVVLKCFANYSKGALQQSYSQALLNGDGIGGAGGRGAA